MGITCLLIDTCNAHLLKGPLDILGTFCLALVMTHPYQYLNDTTGQLMKVSVGFIGLQAL